MKKLFIFLWKKHCEKRAEYEENIQSVNKYFTGEVTIKKLEISDNIENKKNKAEIEQDY